MARPANDPAREVDDHGGSLERAAALFPGAPQPWLDLSTGISPYPYPLPRLPASAFQRLPEEAGLKDLAHVAARAYGAPGAEHVVAAPGTQMLLPLVAALVAPGRAAVLSPTYAEHRRAAALAGHAVAETRDFAALRSADLAIVVNPNNPDGRVSERAALLDLAARLRARGGLLVVDEAFMDVGPCGEALDAAVDDGGLVVLRSFGKFFGLAGVRLGFAIAAPRIAAWLRARLGPWPVSGAAIEIGRQALADHAWQEETRRRLQRRAAQLDALLAENGLRVAGGTPLFRFLRPSGAESLFRCLGEDGILVRSFTEDPEALRLGLPGDDAALLRLSRSLRRWQTIRDGSRR